MMPSIARALTLEDVIDCVTEQCLFASSGDG